MKNAVAVISLLLLAACSAAKPTEEQLANADYGTFPTNHKDIVKEWLHENYGNYTGNLKDLSISNPTKGYLSGGAFSSSDFIFGYLVEVSFNYTEGSGRRSTTTRTLVSLLIHNGKVLTYQEQRV